MRTAVASAFSGDMPRPYVALTSGVISLSLRRGLLFNDGWSTNTVDLSTASESTPPHER